MEHSCIIAGLGNPGEKYERTRHNAGFLVLDEFARALSLGAGSWKEKFDAEYATFSDGGRKVILLKPQTYMNESGRSIQAASRFFKVPPDHVCVVHDDLDFGLGTVRLKFGGGDGGHNGLKSVSRMLSSRQYLRLRFGIGRPNIPQKADISENFVHSWVLGKFSREEDAVLQEALSRATAAIQLLLKDGFEAAQNSVNSRSR
ncbi:aminoacyl-tRNA hydrolase [bacterium]|nr:aminoacyl-tRNA hydrolase [bacterium]